MVSLPRRPRTAVALQVYALYGAPLAWTAQLVLGYGLTEAACGPSGRAWDIPIDTWEAVLTGVTLVIAVGAWASAAVLHRGVQRGEIADPLGRVKFLATIGLVVGAVFVTLIVYTGTGVLTLEECRR
jgi:uncharacterized membrane protein YidH (DUF202 family)